MELASTRRPCFHQRAGWLPTALPLVLLVLLLLATPAAYSARHRGRIVPGVRIAGIAVGGLSPEQAIQRLNAAGLQADPPVTLVTRDETFTRTASSLGLVWDQAAAVERAFGVGRTGPMPSAFLAAVRARVIGTDVGPPVRFSRRQAEQAVEELAAQFDRLPTDADLIIAPDQVTSRPASAGQRLERRAAVDVLAQAAASGRWPPPVIRLPVSSVAPVVRDAARAARQAQRLLSAPITLRAGDTTWQMTPGELAPMLVTNNESGALTLELDRSRLELWLTPVAEAVNQAARNPRFHFDPESRELLLLESGKPGYQLDVTATGQKILAAADGPTRVVQVVTVRSAPTVSDRATAAQLGIREVVHEETSRFVGSPPERIHNIGVAAARFHGLLIAPGEVFSFNEHLGEVTAEAGYRKTKIIMDGATRDGLGGGVCQVSTTLFRAAFWAGLPILERMAHGYRVPYYEQGAPAGLDATVFLPSPDLKFQNDTPAWLLIETSSDPRRATVTFRLLGTRPGREVRLEGPVITNVVPPPPPKVIVDPNLPPGGKNDIELPRSGATVVVTRIIVGSDGQEQREVFRSHYRPTGSITAVGPAPPQGPAQGPAEEAGPGPGAVP